VPEIFPVCGKKTNQRHGNGGGNEKIGWVWRVYLYAKDSNAQSVEKVNYGNTKKGNMSQTCHSSPP
jgi:hypothetical protein